MVVFRVYRLRFLACCFVCVYRDDFGSIRASESVVVFGGERLVQGGVSKDSGGVDCKVASLMEGGI